MGGGDGGGFSDDSLEIFLRSVPVVVYGGEEYQMWRRVRLCSGGRGDSMVINP